MPYAAINDIQATMNHKQGEFAAKQNFFPSANGHEQLIRTVSVDSAPSTSAQHGHDNRAPSLRSAKNGQHAREILLLGAEHPDAAAATGTAHGRDLARCDGDE